jgi:DNA-binding beta-propeller fold protein YncE
MHVIVPGARAIPRSMKRVYNTVSSFLVTESGPKLVSHISSGGSLPISLTSNGHLLYVVNETDGMGGNGNIYGFRFSDSGDLKPLNSTQPLDTKGPVGTAADPAEIDFSPNGRTLVVTLRETAQNTPDLGVIDTFSVGHDGKAGPATATTANAANPFGFSFAGDHAIVSNAGPVRSTMLTLMDFSDPLQFVGTASTYHLSGSGVSASSGPVPSGGRAACWLVVSKKYAFVDNVLSQTPSLGPPDGIGSGGNALTTYSVADDGTLTKVAQTNTGQGTPTDEAISSDGKYLYVTNPTFMPSPDTSHIDEFRIGADGSLTMIGSTAQGMAVGISGAGAH